MTAPSPAKRQRRSKRLPLIVYGLCGAAIGASGWTFHTGKGTSYLSDDPLACVNCHIMRDQYDSWQKSSHHNFATCNSCHVPHDFVGKWYTKAENGIRHSFYFTFQNFHEPIQAQPAARRILEHNCRDCHAQLTAELLANEQYPAKIPPSSECADNCLHCHRQVGHGAMWH